MKKNAESEVVEPGERLFRKLDWSAFWTACVVSFCVYFYTLAPTVTLEDSGELGVAGTFLGVPHPPGYPLWSMLAWLFTKIFAFVKFRGQPNPAWSIGLMSAVFGSIATGMTAMLVCRSGSDILGRATLISHDMSKKTENLFCWVSGVVCSLVFAFSPVMWSQSVIIEVYSLNAFFLVLIFLLVYMWMRRPSNELLYITGFVFGLGLTNYYALLLAALALVVAIMLGNTKLFRDFAIVGAPFAVAILGMKMGLLPQISHPAHISCLVYMSLNFMVLVLAYFLLPHGKTVALTFLLAEVGLAFYAYMPIVSDLRNPPMNWGYPRTFEGFKHAVSRGQYEKIVPSDVFSMKFIEQLGFYLSDLRGQFTLPVALIGFIPFTCWSVRIAGRQVNAMLVAIVLSVLAAIIILAEEFLVPAGEAPASAVYKLLILCVIGMLGVGAVTVFVSEGKELTLKLTGKTKATTSERWTVAFIFVGVILAYVYYAVQLARKIIVIAKPLTEAEGTLAGEKIREIVIQSGGIIGIMLLPALLMVLVLILMHSPLKLNLTIDPVSRKWVIATLFGFATMGVMFIALANLKLDIQDTFIQRVKFISSHALYAFWIGYGLVFGLSMVDGLFRGNTAIRGLSLITALMLPVIPICQNAYNRELIRKFGGAEQNGHDFGWQFGNYQLRGAESISEELSPDEEPLPNPSFPPEMSPDPIFFGGTDPGRFVPTYMIYSADVREDAYLITQNALADNTYMSVMRDLYGDRIWIPAQPDSAKAFQRYVEEVNAGTRPKNAELKIENGRVQVSGALGVMEINGILAQMIFEHNNYRHDFYVEESYVIRWMYPYLAPHGLIMKINRDQISNLTDEMVKNDMDFWDWYTRRLAGDEKFRRDVVARKSFSKLRSAIAGVYSFRRMWSEAARAFQEARILYPISPEANFRLVHEVFFPERRFDEAREVIVEFEKQDPNNGRTGDLIRHIEGIKNMEVRIGELEQANASGKMDIGNAMELADLYHKSGRMPQFMALTGTIIQNTNLPPHIHFGVAQLLARAGQKAQTLKALDLCSSRMPANTPPNVYMSIAKMYSEIGETDRMSEMLERCRQNLPPETPPQVLVEIASFYAQANMPEQMMNVMEDYLKRVPSDWRGWLDLAAMQLHAKLTRRATHSLEQALLAGGNAAIATINNDRRFDPIREAAMTRVRKLPGLGF